MKDKENYLNEKLSNSFTKIDNINIDTPDLEYFSSFVRDEKAKIEKANNKQFALFIICALVLASISISMLIYYTELFMKLHILLLLLPVPLLIIRTLIKPKGIVK